MPVANFRDRMAIGWRGETPVANFEDKVETKWRWKMPVANLGDGIAKFEDRLSQYEFVSVVCSRML